MMITSNISHDLPQLFQTVPYLTSNFIPMQSFKGEEVSNRDEGRLRASGGAGTRPASKFAGLDSKPLRLGNFLPHPL